MGWVITRAAVDHRGAQTCDQQHCATQHCEIHVFPQLHQMELITSGTLTGSNESALSQMIERGGTRTSGSNQSITQSSSPFLKSQDHIVLGARAVQDQRLVRARRREVAAQGREAEEIRVLEA